MSLQQAAQHLAAQGRGKDTTLVHMTPNEVRGLQQIAMAAGGSLTLNPSTGLPEAGFLEDMLPMIIGGGLAVATGGTSLALTPGMIGLGVGGVQALRTGNLMDGVKAGLGAYGGAGLGAGLMGAGAQSIASATPVATSAAGETLAGTGAGAGIAPASNIDKLSAGFQGLGTSEGWKNLASSSGGAMGLAKSGLAGIAPMLMAEPEAPPPTTPDASMGQRYSYNAGPTTPFPESNVPRAGSPEQFQSFGKEQRYFTPGYTKIGAEDARKLYGFAEGGETTFKYDPGKQQYEAIKQGQSRSPTTKELVNSSVVDVHGDGDGAGSGLGPSGSSSSLGHGIGAISAGQALSSYGSMLGGMMPGGMLAGLIGSGMLASGINSLGEAEAAAHSMGGDFAGHAGLDAGSFGYGSDAGWGAGDQGGWGGDAGGYGGDAGGDAGGGGDGGGGGGGGGGDGGGGAGEANGGLMHAYAAGGYNLGDYSDGGRLLRGPGDGVSDSIPATIGKKQPARLADGEFVVPARIVSELGNGSTEAGARKLYAMMNRIQSARGKTVGKGKVAKNSRAERHLPA
jgi:hypothetical protein